ncbi:MAG TPA: iron-containing redox enzyme family protein [Chloroflexota bacterium]
MAAPAALMTSREFVQQFKKDVRAHHKLRVNHPFVHAVREGRATMDQLREWARQDYKFRAAVPRIAMMRYLACSDPDFGAQLYEVVEEETQGLSTGSAGHSDLFVRFASSIGVSERELEEAPLAPATAAHLYFAELTIHKYPWFVVMAAQIAAEGTFTDACLALADGLMANYNLSPEAVAFFTVHGEADEQHGSLAEEIAEAYLHSPALQQQTREVGFRRMDLLYDIWSIPGL